jgi:hypothetical protein
MTARVGFINMKNFPVLTVNGYEGTLTRYTTGFNEVGGQQDVAVYSLPISKGDVVALYGHAQVDCIQVRKMPAANDTSDEAIGIAVSSPQGIDNSTTSTQTPTYVYQRKVDVALFGIGVVDLVAQGTVRPGYKLGWSEATDNAVVEVTALESNTASFDLVALGYATTGVKVPVLVGYSGFAPAD